jgi:hypothetical protein
MSTVDRAMSSVDKAMPAVNCAAAGTDYFLKKNGNMKVRLLCRLPFA